MEEDDHISRLPDAVLGEIVSLLRTKDGGRTQAIATRWRHIWSSSPLNIDLHDRPPIQRRIPPARISGILSSHRGPGRRFCIPSHYFEDDEHPAATLDAWLRSPALDGTRWRHIWSSSPLNIDLHDRPPIQRRIPPARISGILSSHRGPGRRFCIPSHYFEDDEHPAATLDAWLRSPALDGLQELDFDYGAAWCRLQRQRQRQRQGIARLVILVGDTPSPAAPPLPPLPESAARFSSTLQVARFGGCAFPDENKNSLHLPLLKQLSLMSVDISETSLYALLAGCPLLQSLMLTTNIGCSRIRIVSLTLRSIGVESSWGGILLDQLTIEDAPVLERLLLLGHGHRPEMVISVISAPNLKILGQLPVQNPILEFGTLVFKGSCVLNSTKVLPSVKVLALTHINLSLDEVIAFMKCFPCLENLYIKMSTMYLPSKRDGVTNAWRCKYQSLIDTLDIRLKKIMLSTYLGNQAHVNFAEFFVLNARVLESMVLEVDVSKYHDKEWIKRQQTLLQIKGRASRDAHFDFVSPFDRPISRDHYWYEQAHDLSTADPFVGFEFWADG